MEILSYVLLVRRAAKWWALYSRKNGHSNIARTGIWLQKCY